MRHVNTSDGVQFLAAEILDARTKPLVLISSDNEGQFLFDPERIERELGSDADVVTIAHGAVTYALADALPDKANVHSGAARSFPVDFGSDPDWRRSILRFPDRHTEEELIEDALAQVPFVPLPAPTVRREWVRATVERVSGGTGNVAKLDNGALVRVVGGHLPPSVALSDALSVGDPVEGWLIDRDLAPESENIDFSRFEDGSITLARVAKVTPARAKLVLHPALPDGYDLRKRDVIPGVDDGENTGMNVSDVVRVGQTVRARVTRTGETLALSLVDVSEDAPLVPPLSLLKGGAPWLQEGIDAEDDAPARTAPAAAIRTPAPATEPHSPVAPASPPPTASTNPEALIQIRDELEALREAFSRLSREMRSGTDLGAMDRLRDESLGLAAELQRERSLRRERDTTIAGLRVELREARAQRGTVRQDPHTDRAAWPDDEAWLRFEVLTTWASRTIATEKKHHPLGDYSVGAGLVPSLLALDDGQLDKALRTIVDVVTGRAAQITARQLHRLREGQGGSDPYVVREDGAVCWRASIEVNVASARRLHYWQTPGGRIDLSRVVLHDDFRP
ncbi:hypothetical protein AB0N59_02145 [Microbacterium sp. NPDC089321]|uniref:hypothetical protein n=1 Tax=Microbacterium sp. NPDC089321 TaxID=3155183 RepID=UPI003428FDA2